LNERENNIDNIPKINRAEELNRELFRRRNKAQALNQELFTSATEAEAVIAAERNACLREYEGTDKNGCFNDGELCHPSPVRRVWLGAIACLIAMVMGFFGAVLGIYALTQAGFTDSDSLLGDLIIDASGLETHKVVMNETDISYTGGFIEVSEKLIPSVVELTELKKNETDGYDEKGTASGVIISADGYIVTNEHVTNGMDNIRVKLSDGSEYIADIIGQDSLTDLAVIKVTLPKGVSLTPVTLGTSASVRYGQSVVVIGNPMGIGTSVSTGIISCPDREISSNGETIQVIQTNAEVSPGNSGGGMFDVYGNLLGVVCAKTSGDGIEGLGYAVPSDTVKIVINDIMQYGYVKGRAALGVTVASIFDSAAYNYYRDGELAGYLFNSRYGVYIISTMRSTELKRGDRLIMIDGKRVTSSGMITEMLKDKKPGDTMTVTVERLTIATDDGNAIETHNVTIELFERNW